MTSTGLPQGILSVVQTSFQKDGSIDFASLERLTNAAIVAGVAGFLVPVVASEVAQLTLTERRQILEQLVASIRGRVPLIVGASADDPQQCREMSRWAVELNATAWLVAVPQSLYQRLDEVIPFFREATRDCGLPLLIQDLQFNGPGLPLPLIVELRATLPTLCGMKIETAPAGPKFSAVRDAMEPDFFIAGGWAVPQMIEALDRGVDAMVPESAMIPVYHAIDQLYRTGQRDQAVELFRSLLPVLVFTNQELALSIAFFKRLLVRKGLFTTETLRIPGFTWDRHQLRIADELIDYYLELEARVLRD